MQLADSPITHMSHVQQLLRTVLQRHYSVLSGPRSGIHQLDHLQPGNIPTNVSSTHVQLKELFIRKAEFIKGSSEVSQLPKPAGPEFAFIGHSNVGKSSLINMLAGVPGLANVSKKPGRTRCINHFLINDRWYMVDCPGYGYARVSKEERLQWHDLTKEYFVQRKSLAQVLLLIDGSHPPQAIDVECALWLTDSKVPYTLIFTKVDISSAQAPSVGENIATFNNAIATMAQGFQPPYMPTSAVTGHGRAALTMYLAQLRQTFRMPVVFK